MRGPSAELGMTSASGGSREPRAHRHHSSSSLRVRNPRTCLLLFCLSAGVAKGYFVYVFDGVICFCVVLNDLTILLSVSSQYSFDYLLQEMVRR